MNVRETGFLTLSFPDNLDDLHVGQEDFISGEIESLTEFFISRDENTCKHISPLICSSSGTLFLRSSLVASAANCLLVT